MKLIIDIPEKMYHMINAGQYDYGDMNVIIRNGTPIPDNATNGDVVKSIFTNTLDNFCERTTWEWNRWWNAPCQKGANK